MALKPQRGFNRRLALWRDSAEPVFWWEVIWRWDSAAGAWGGWTALIGGQQGYRNKAELRGVEI